MTAVINNVMVQGTPEEIKVLIDLYIPPVGTTSANYGEEVPVSEGWEFTGTPPDVKLTYGNIGGKPL